jgi:hypothetical protein
MRRVFPQVKNRKAAKALIGLVVVALIPAWIYVEKRLSPNANDAKLREVEELFDSIPTWPRSIELDVHRDSKAGLAGFSESYKFDGGFDEVGQYYKETLMQRGWAYRGEHHVKDWWRDLGGRELLFQKGEYEFTVFYYGEHSDSKSIYSLSCGWEK